MLASSSLYDQVLLSAHECGPDSDSIQLCRRGREIELCRCGADEINSFAVGPSLFRLLLGMIEHKAWSGGGKTVCRVFFNGEKSLAANGCLSKRLRQNFLAHSSSVSLASKITDTA